MEHNPKFMVGEVRANFDVSLWKRYFRFSKHRKPGKIVKAILGAVTALEMQFGVAVYG